MCHVTGRPSGRTVEDLTEPAVAFVGLPGPAFAAGDVVAGAASGPRGQRAAVKPSHVLTIQAGTPSRLTHRQLTHLAAVASVSSGHRCHSPLSLHRTNEPKNVQPTVLLLGCPERTFSRFQETTLGPHPGHGHDRPDHHT
jgi:hypothetical protein